MRRASRQDAAALSLIAYFRKRAKRGNPEARRDWLYGPAHIPPGTWDQEAMLDDVIRRAKDIGAEDGFELIYVYDRPPVWTCEPSDYVRDKSQEMSIKRQSGETARTERISPAGSHNEIIANANHVNLEAGRRMLRVPSTPPSGDLVIARIDAIPGLAN